MIEACPGCGEIPEPLDVADLGLGLFIAHRGGCTAVPDPHPLCTCYDPASMEYGPNHPCDRCRQLERNRAEQPEPEGFAR